MLSVGTPRILAARLEQVSTRKLAKGDSAPRIQSATILAAGALLTPWKRQPDSWHNDPEGLDPCAAFAFYHVLPWRSR